MTRFRRYGWLTLLLSGGALAMVAAANALIDPFGAFPSVALKRFEPHRARPHSRISKAELLINHDCDILLLGSSRTLSGFSPWHPAFASTNVLNLGLQGALMSEVRAAFDLALQRTHVQQIIFGVDFILFRQSHTPAPDFASSRFNTEVGPAEYHLKLLLGAEALDEAKFVFNAQRRNRRPDSPGRGFLAHQVPPGRSQRDLIEKHIQVFFSERAGTGGDYNREALQELRYIIRKCRAEGITLALLIPPTHALNLETVRGSGSWERFEQWKSDLVQLIAEEKAGDEVPLWDFTGYTGYVAEPIPQTRDPKIRMEWYFETGHFTPKLGDIVLDTVVRGKSPPGFGVKLTPANLTNHLGRIRRDREVFARQFPRDVDWVAELARRFGRTGAF